MTDRLLADSLAESIRYATPNTRRSRAPSRYRHSMLVTAGWFLVVVVALLVLASLSETASAAVVAVSENQAGGSIRLLDDRSERCGPKERVAITSTRGGGLTIFGCWAVVSDSLVMIRWLDDGSITTLDPAIFRLYGVEDEPQDAADVRL